VTSSLEIRIEAGDDTESLVQTVLKDLSDEEIDQLGVKREYAPVSGLASEPVTIAVILVASLKAAAAVGSALAAYIKYKTEKLKKEAVSSPGSVQPAPITIQTSQAAPSELKDLRSTEYVKVAVDSSK
jgi:hypothetical protein